MVPHFSSPDYSKLLSEQEMLLMNGLRNVNIAGNGYLEQRVQGGLSGLQSMAYSHQISIDSGGNITNLMHNQMKVTGETIPSMLDSVLPSVAPSDAISLKFTEAPLAASKKNPVSRPSKPSGPPPGFNHVTPKRQEESISTANLQNPQVDDYSWLDGHQTSGDRVQNLRAVYPDVRGTSTTFTTTFPFPVKQQVSVMHAPMANEKTWQDFHLFDPAKQNIFQSYQQRNQQSGQMAEQESANPVWHGRFRV
jgi:protein SMG7